MDDQTIPAQRVIAQVSSQRNQALDALALVASERDMLREALDTATARVKELEAKHVDISTEH